jgi:hypothetical protein
MTGLVGPTTRLWPEPVRPAPLDGPYPDVLCDLEGEFVVDWQVSDRPTRVSTPPDVSQVEILFP